LGNHSWRLRAARFSLTWALAVAMAAGLCLHVAAPTDYLTVATIPAGGRRMLLSCSVAPLILEQGTAATAQIYRTTKESPTIDKVLAVMLLRTTYDAAEDSGFYRDMVDYQKQFSLSVRSGFKNFKGRYENYDLTELYNASRLLETRSGGVTNRFYFSFLNDAQWRTVAKAIKRKEDRVQFSRMVGARLYQSILAGQELKADVPQDSPGYPSEGPNNNIGTWPKLTEGPPQGRDAASISIGAKQLLDYLRGRGYCKDFEVTDIKLVDRSNLSFDVFVLDPVNFDATASLMRSNDDFVPRYDQRILQAFFADRGYSSTFTDGLASGMDDMKPATKQMGIPTGIRSTWVLKPEPDAGI